MTFTNKIVWITGASSGIGAALAVEMAERGATLVLSARRKELLQDVRSRCQRSGEHMILPLDVTATGTHAEAFVSIVRRFDRLDVLVNNAGIGQRGKILNNSLEVERRIMEVNFFGAVSVTRSVLPHMVKRGSGRIVVISSVRGKISTPGHATYSASKHALHGYFEGLRAELYKTGVTISMICPGYVQTDISMHSVRSDGSSHGRMDREHVGAITADAMARKTVRAIERNRQEYFVGGPEIYAPMLQRFFPWLVRRLLPRVLSG